MEVDTPPMLERKAGHHTLLPSRASTPSPTTAGKRTAAGNVVNDETDVHVEAAAGAPTTTACGKRLGVQSTAGGTNLFPTNKYKKQRLPGHEHNTRGAAAGCLPCSSQPSTTGNAADDSKKSKGGLSLTSLPDYLVAKILSMVPEQEVANVLSVCRAFGGSSSSSGERRRRSMRQKVVQARPVGLAREVWQMKCQQLEEEWPQEPTFAQQKTLKEEEAKAADDIRHNYEAIPASTVCSGETTCDDAHAPPTPPRSFYHYLRHRLHWQLMARRMSRNRLRAPVREQGATVGTSCIGGDASKLTYIERAQCVGWLLDVGDEYDLPARTMHLAVSYLDRALGCAQLSMLSTRSGGSASCAKKAAVSRDNLQLIGTACLALAWAHHRGCLTYRSDNRENQENREINNNNNDNDEGSNNNNNNSNINNNNNNSNNNNNGDEDAAFAPMVADGNNHAAAGVAVNDDANAEADAANAAAAGEVPLTRNAHDGTVTKVPPFRFFVELMDGAFTAHEIALACGMLLFHVLDDECELSAEVLVGPNCRFTRERWQELSRATRPARVLGNIDARSSQNGNQSTPATSFLLIDDTIRRADLALGPQGISVSEREASLRAGQNPAQSVRVAPSSDELRSLLCRLKDAHLEQPSRDWLPVFLSANEWFHGQEEGVTHYAKYLLELALVSPLGLKHRHADLAAAAAWLARFVSRMRFQPVPALGSGPDEVASAAATAVSKCHESMPARIGCAVDQIKAAMMPPMTLADGSDAPPLLIHGFANAQCVPAQAVSSAIRMLACIAWDPKDVAGIVEPTDTGDDDDDDDAALGTPNSSSSSSTAEETARDIVRRVCEKYRRPCFRHVAEWNKPFGLDLLLAFLPA